MSDSSRSNIQSCCTMEKERLIQDIRECDFCSTDWEDHHRCLSSAAKESYRRSKACAMA